MAGTVAGGRKARDVNLERDPDFYKKIGHLGGTADYRGKRGFAAMPREFVSAAGRKGGSISKRTVKVVLAEEPKYIKPSLWKAVKGRIKIHGE